MSQTDSLANSYKSVWLILALLVAPRVYAEQVVVAVAANFIAPARAIAAEFEVQSGHRVTLSAASTGKLYAQIVNGAPFDVLLAADSATPGKLEERGLAVGGSRFTYAVGQLVLWSRDGRLRDADGEAVLRSGAFEHLALANPRTAPYGAAGLTVLQRLGLEQALAGKIVRAEDVGQAFQFAATGNVEFAFVALSQARQMEQAPGGSLWQVPASWYAPILQQAVLLTPARDSAAARMFLAFLRGAAGVAMVERFGYARPEQANLTEDRVNRYE